MTIVSDGDPISTAVFPYVHFGWMLIYDGRPIARINASAGLAPAPGMIVAPSPDSEAMLPETLDRLIEKLQQEEADAAENAEADTGDRRFAGRLARYLLAAHSLTVYATAVEAFLSSLPPARQEDSDHGPREGR